MKIFLIRHGESTKNAGECTLDDWKVPLTNKGNQQALQLGKDLLRYCNDNNIKLANSVMISSPYIRAKQTAHNINQSLKLPLLINYSLSEYQHENSESINIIQNEINQNLLKHSPMLENIYKTQTKFNPNENEVEIVLRAKSLITSLKKLPYDNIFIISHKGFIKAFNTAFNNKEYSYYFNHQNIKNCSVMYFIIQENELKDEGNILNF